MATVDRSTSEVWKSLARLPGYEFSDRGRVQSYWKVINEGRRGGAVWRLVARPRIRHPSPDKDGYLILGARDVDGILRKYRVHRLILEAFVGPCPDGLEGCHRDGCFAHNWLGNLYWGTHGQNVRDTIRHGRHNKTKLWPADVQEVLELHAGGISNVEIARRKGVTRGTIWRILQRHGPSAVATEG